MGRLVCRAYAACDGYYFGGWVVRRCGACVELVLRVREGKRRVSWAID